MGSRFSQFLDRVFRKSDPELRVGMLGLDNAGKTTILYQFKLERNVHPVPTIGFNVETIRCGRFLLNVWDVSGRQPKTRVIWQHYNQNTKVIIFVVDSSDIERIPEANRELMWLRQRLEINKATFLIFANKQDLPGALSAAELVTLLDLSSMTQKWTIQECCAISGLGLMDGLEQLQEMLEDGKRRRDSLKLINK